MSDAVFDPCAQGIQRLEHRVFDEAVAFGRDLRRGAAVPQVLADRVAVVALVGQQRTGIAYWRTAVLRQLFAVASIAASTSSAVQTGLERAGAPDALKTVVE